MAIAARSVDRRETARSEPKGRSRILKRRAAQRPAGEHRYSDTGAAPGEEPRKKKRRFESGVFGCHGIKLPGGWRAWAQARIRGGGLSETRTRDQRIKSPLLYRLSYQPDRSPKLWLISWTLSKNRGQDAFTPELAIAVRQRRRCTRPAARCGGTVKQPFGPPQWKTAACAAVLHRGGDLAYQAATTAPLNLVSMNCFTAGLW